MYHTKVHGNIDEVDCRRTVYHTRVHGNIDEVDCRRTVYHTTVHGIEARLTVVELCITQRCME